MQEQGSTNRRPDAKSVRNPGNPGPNGFGPIRPFGKIPNKHCGKLEQRKLGKMASIATVTLVVADYDDAIGFYRDRLGFTLVADTPLPDGKRWVLVAPAGGGARLLLAKADGEAQAARIGDQTGGRVGFFLETEDFASDHARFTAKGVRFLEPPRHEAYGSVAVFEDLYGNKWDLIQPKA